METHTELLLQLKCTFVAYNTHTNYGNHFSAIICIKTGGDTHTKGRKRTKYKCENINMLMARKKQKEKDPTLCLDSESKIQETKTKNGNQKTVKNSSEKIKIPRVISNCLFILYAIFAGYIYRYIKARIEEGIFLYNYILKPSNPGRAFIFLYNYILKPSNQATSYMLSYCHQHILASLISCGKISEIQTDLKCRGFNTLLYPDGIPRMGRTSLSVWRERHPEIGQVGSLQSSKFPDFLCLGGDLTAGNGTSGETIYGSKFADENLVNPT